MLPGNQFVDEPMDLDVMDNVDDMNENEGDGHHNNRGQNGNGGRPVEDPAAAGPEQFVVENPNIELDTYCQSYSGLARIQRLIHIADHCPSLRIEALKQAISYVTQTLNVDMYQLLHRKLKEGNDLPAGLPTSDPSWIEATTRRGAVKLEKLDVDLKSHRANSIKESIRRGYDDLGEYYLEVGDLINALKSFTRTRDYCTSAKHVITMCLNIVKTSVYMENWPHVMNYVMKAESTPDPTDDKKKDANKDQLHTAAKLKAAMGLAELASKKYRAAAKCFLQVNFEHFDCPDLISQSNVAVYAGLCALATFTRTELKNDVISSGSFKLFLELEPPVREVIHSFYDSKYAKCLNLMDEMRDNLLLDVYLAQHVHALYSKIRSRGMVQYFAPFQTADLRKMAENFNTSVPLLENELMTLILSGQIQARIDSQNKVLHVKSQDERSMIFEKALKLGEEYERKTKLMILRSSLLKAQIRVKSPQKEELTIETRETRRNSQL